MTKTARACPECGTEVVAASGGRFYNGIRPKDRTIFGCEFCDPTPLSKIATSEPRRVGQSRKEATSGSR